MKSRRRVNSDVGHLLKAFPASEAVVETNSPKKVTKTVTLFSNRKERNHMRTIKVTALLLVLWLAPSHVAARTFSQAGTTTLHLVQKIYVDEMGNSPEAARFRLLLEDQLSARGFTVVDSAQKADAVLSGATSVARSGIYGGPADISVTARLSSPDGGRLWSANIGGQMSVINPIKALKFKEPVEYRARELAKKLRSDWEKSAKAAGAKVSK
jgi:hypothetical protein